MKEYDVVIIGAGAAGLSAGALLAKEGKSVLVCEKSPYLGGRALAVEDQGFKVNIGGHLIEDGGSGITKIFENVGKELIHGKVNAEMPVWDHEKNQWGSIRDRYATDKTELKKVIKALVDTPFEELDRWDDRNLRDWIHQYTHDQGVVDLFEFLAVLECLTDEPWDHSASDNLFVRKMHYQERRMAAYSCWPGQGWARLWQDLADACTEQGGEVRLNTPVSRVVIEDREVKGVEIPSEAPILPGVPYGSEPIKTNCVISTLPVWSVLNVVPESHLPDWYAGQIRYLAQDKFRVAWLGLYMATDEPLHIYDPKELSTWLHDPVAGLPGFFFTQSNMDPSTAPEGKHLHVMGGVIPGEKGRDKEYVRETFDKFEQGMGIMYPALQKPVWKRRTLVFDPAFGVIQKPCLVGSYRPHWRAPNVSGLYFASETFKSRGIGVDRAARAALTCVEDYLGRRLSGFEETWRY
jgi:phytoene dehydrogenase-like protein